MALINETSVVLQSTQLDILRANEHVVNLSAELAILRTDTAWDKAVSKARNFADKVGVDCELKEPRKRKVPVAFRTTILHQQL